MKKSMVLVNIFFITSFLQHVYANEMSLKHSIENIQGNPLIKNKYGQNIIRKNTKITPGSVIYTDHKSSFTIRFQDNTTLHVHPFSVMKADEMKFLKNAKKYQVKYSMKFRLKLGKVRANITKQKNTLKRFSVQTPAGVASVRGTEKEISYSPDGGMEVKVLSGIVLVESQAGKKKYMAKDQKTNLKKGRDLSYKDELDEEEEKMDIVEETEPSNNIIEKQTRTVPFTEQETCVPCSQSPSEQETSSIEMLSRIQTDLEERNLDALELTRVYDTVNVRPSQRLLLSDSGLRRVKNFIDTRGQAIIDDLENMSTININDSKFKSADFVNSARRSNMLLRNYKTTLESLVTASENERIYGSQYSDADDIYQDLVEAFEVVDGLKAEFMQIKRLSSKKINNQQIAKNHKTYIKNLQILSQL